MTFNSLSVFGATVLMAMAAAAALVWFTGQRRLRSALADAAAARADATQAQRHNSVISQDLQELRQRAEHLEARLVEIESAPPPPDRPATLAIDAHNQADGVQVLSSNLTKQLIEMKKVASSFDRWHEQMGIMMSQNREMYARNDELTQVAKSVVLLAINAGIEAARSGLHGRGFAVVAQEIQALAARSQDLANEYTVSLQRNDLATTITFQELQAAGKLLMSGLSVLDELNRRITSKVVPQVGQLN